MTSFCLKAAPAALAVMLLPFAGPAFAADELRPATGGAAEVVIAGVRNAFRASERVYSGSQPEGDAAFVELAKMGVKTIISVDGGKPDVEAARKHGLRYIHLPIGYDRVPADRAEQLAQAAKTAEGKVFVHCHHGKHRGPAAVAIVCRTMENWTPERAEAWLKQAGTAPDYPGLYRSVREYQTPSAARLAKVGPLPEIAKTEALVDAMVAIDEQFDHLKAIEKTGWKAPPSGADLSPAHEATLLWEQLRELARTDDTAKRPEDYRTKLAGAERAAAALRIALGAAPPDLTAASAALKESSQQCGSCHKAFRNEKKK